MTRTFPRSLVVTGGALGVILILVVGGMRLGVGFATAAVLGLSLMIPLVRIALRHERLLVGLLCAVAVIMPGLSYSLAWPASLQYAVDVMAIVFFAIALARRSKRGLRIRLDRPIIAFCLLLVVLVLVTQSFSLAGIQSLWSLILGPLVVIAVLNSELHAADVRSLVRWLFVLCLFQLAVELVQRFVLQIESVDRIGGTLGRAGTTQIGVLMACFWVAVIAYVTAMWRWRAGVLLLVPLLAMGLAEAKAGYLLAAIGTVFVAGAWLIRRQYKRALVAGAAVVLPILIVYLLLRYFPQLVFGSKSAGEYWLRALANPQSQMDYLQSYSAGGQAQRLASLTVSWGAISSKGAVPFGLGLGALNSSPYLSPGAAITPWLADTLAWTPSAGRMLLESGLLGISSLCLLFFAQCRHGLTLLKMGGEPHSFLGAACIGIVPVFVLGGFYTTAWTFRALSIPFWVFVALLRLQEKSQPKPSPRRAGARARRASRSMARY